MLTKLYFNHRYLEAEIHYFEFLDNTREAVHHWLDSLSAILENQASIGRMLVDFSQSGMPSVRQFTDALQDWQKRHFIHKAWRLAYIYDSGTASLSAFRTLIYAITHHRPVEIRFFPSDSIPQAMNWLETGEL